MRRYKVTFRRRKTRSVQTAVVTSKHIGKTAALNDALMQANALAPDDSWSVELLEVDTDGYQSESAKKDAVMWLIKAEDAKTKVFAGEIDEVDYSTYLPLLAKRISEMEFEVRS
jgi:hypothetical protein